MTPFPELPLDVSRETLERLETHRRLLTHWNPRINLVSRNSLDDAWTRHFADSAQLWALRPPQARRWLDLGSGAGFPGLVIAALAAEATPGLEVTLVEADQRKATFLATAAREMGLSVAILTERIEALPPQDADVISARALAALEKLMAFMEKHRLPNGIGLFPKGETVHKEVGDAARRWRFEHKIHASVTDPRAAIVEVGVIDRA